MKDDHVLQEVSWKGFSTSSKIPIQDPHSWKSSNEDITLFRTTERAAFRAHKIGLKSHKECCDLPLCEICQFAENVMRFSWDNKNFSKYLKPLEIWPKLSDRGGPIKHVTFSGPTPSTKGHVRLELNMLRLYQACFHNVSLSETNNLRMFKTNLWNLLKQA